MLTNRKICSLLVVLGLAWVLVPAGAHATPTWDTTVSPTSTSCPASCSSKHEGLLTTDLTMLPYGNQFTYTNGNGSLNATAYFVQPASSSFADMQASTLQIANIEEYVGNGIGVTSKTITPTFVENVGNVPGHTIDNQGVYDMVVFQLPSNNFDVTQIGLKTFSTLNNPSGPQYPSGAADFTIFVGGNPSANALGLAGFASVSIDQLTSLYGFTEIDYASAGSGTYNVNSNKLTGRYLIVAASLRNASVNDDFKITSINGVKLTVAEPSTALLLFGPAWFLMVQYRRRRTARC